MLVPFAVDPNALLERSEDLTASRATHLTFLELWRTAGVLVCDQEVNGKSLRKAVTQMRDQTLRKWWQSSLKHNRYRELEDTVWPDLTRAEASEDLAALVPPVRVACLESTRALEFGVLDGEFSRRCSVADIEMCVMDALGRSASFREAKRLAQTDVETETRTALVWQERFAALAQYSDFVVVVDAYCLWNHANAVGKGDLRASGLHRLLIELDATGLGHDVTVFTTAGEAGKGSPGMTRDKAEALWRQEWDGMSGSGIRRLCLRLSPSASRFTSIFPDRFLRFDSTVANIGHGLEILAGEKTRRYTTFLLAPQETKAGIEKRLRDCTEEIVFSRT